MGENRRSLAAGEQNHGIAGLGHTITQNVYRFGFEGSEMDRQTRHAGTRNSSGSASSSWMLSSQHKSLE